MLSAGLVNCSITHLSLWSGFWGQAQPVKFVRGFISSLWLCARKARQAPLSAPPSFYRSWPFSVSRVMWEGLTSSPMSWIHAYAHRELARRSSQSRTPSCCPSVVRSERPIGPISGRLSRHWTVTTQFSSRSGFWGQGRYPTAKLLPPAYRNGEPGYHLSSGFPAARLPMGPSVLLCPVAAHYDGLRIHRHRDAFIPRLFRVRPARPRRWTFPGRSTHLRSGTGRWRRRLPAAPADRPCGRAGRAVRRRAPAARSC